MPTAVPSRSSKPTYLPTPQPSQAYDAYAVEFKETGSCQVGQGMQDDHRANSADECWSTCSRVFEEEELTLVAVEYYPDKSRGTDGCVCHMECECLTKTGRDVSGLLMLPFAFHLPDECGDYRRRRLGAEEEASNAKTNTSDPTTHPTTTNPTQMPSPLPTLSLPPTPAPSPFPSHAPSRFGIPHYLNGQNLSATDITMTVTLQVRASLALVDHHTYGNFRDTVETDLVAAEEDGSFEATLVAICRCTSAAGYFRFPKNVTNYKVRDSFTFQNEPGETPRDYPTLHPTPLPSVTQMPTQCDDKFELCTELRAIYEP